AGTSAETAMSAVICQNVTKGYQSKAGETSGPGGSFIHSGSWTAISGDHSVTASEACWRNNTRGFGHWLSSGVGSGHPPQNSTPDTLLTVGSRQREPGSRSSTSC